MSCEAGYEVRLISHFYFLFFQRHRGEEQHVLANPKHLQFKSLKKPNHHARVLEVFVGTYNAKRKKVTQKTKKTKKTPSNNCSANNTNNAPIINRYTCKCYTRNLSPFLFADSWHRTCLEVANFLRGQRVIYQQFQTNHNPNQPQIIITKSRVRHTQKKLLKYS